MGQVSPERLQQLLLEHQQVESQGLPQPGETFTDAVAPRKRIVTTVRATQLSMYKLWLLWLFHIAPPAFVAWSAHHWQVRPLLRFYLAGAIASVIFYFVITRWMGLWGRAKLQADFRSSLLSEGIEVGEFEGQMVGLSPSEVLRFYLSNFNWDTGYLFLADGRLCYVGDQTRFSLRPDQLRDVRLGPGVPAWFPVARVYFDWWDETSASIRTWNMVSTMPCSIWDMRRQSLDLYAAIQRWRTNPTSYSEAPQLMKELPIPAIGEVTGLSLKTVYGTGRALKNLIQIMLLAYAGCWALGIPSFWYVGCVILLLRLYEILPHWFYKEPQVVMQPKANAAAVGLS